MFATGTLWFLLGGLVRANAALREARAELAELAVAEERLRFARDLHDLLGHDLSLIALKAELAGKLLPPTPTRRRPRSSDIKRLTRSALAQVRQAVDGYRRPTLAGELAGARVALEAAGIELQVERPDAPLDPEVESVLAWAVREGATNVIRHSGARHAAIRSGRARRAELEITDDGRGTAPAPARPRAGRPARARAVDRRRGSRRAPARGRVPAAVTVPAPGAEAAA